jgi:predicted transposase YbfD/YdcC
MDEFESLYQIFYDLKDERNDRGKQHRLIDVLILSIYGLLAGYTDFFNMCYFLNHHKKYFEKKLGLLNGIPSHDTFSRIFRIIDPRAFFDRFVLFISKIYEKKGKQIAIDGKAIRAARDQINKKNVPYIVSAFATEEKLSLSQIKVNEKSSEVTAIPELLKIIDIEGAVITIDAAGTHSNIADLIVKKKSDYVLSLKDNQKLMKENVEYYFKNEQFNIKKNVISEKNHGRIERRTYYTFPNLTQYGKIIKNDEWDSIKSIGVIERTRILNGEQTIELAYYIASFNLTNELLSKYVRDHWAIENTLHWVLDHHFKEDRSTANKDNAMENLSILRKIVYNLMNIAGKKNNKTKGMMFTDLKFNLKEAETILFDALNKK